jgi:hypothetical protein
MNQFSSFADVIAVATAEMNVWGLVDRGWTFKVDKAKSRHGLCSYKNKRLSITQERIKYDSKEDVVNTIRHEIAHALHYEQYVDEGRKEDFFARRFTGRKWVRKVRPHGVEWKRIASKVGVKNPGSRSKGNAQKMEIQPWRLVFVNNGEVEDLETGFHRFPKNLSKRYMRGRMECLGKLFLVKKAEWIAFINGKKTVEQLSFYQDLNTAPVSNGVSGLSI